MGIYQNFDNNTSLKVIFGMIVLLILEKWAQRWITDRFGCTIDKIVKCKEITERIKLVEENKSLEDFPYNPIQIKQDEGIFVTNSKKDLIEMLI
jgi:hypothetical protein